MSTILDEATLASMEPIPYDETIATLIDNVRRLKQALEIARSWMDPGFQKRAYNADMARIRELVGEVTK